MSITDGVYRMLSSLERCMYAINCSNLYAMRVPYSLCICIPASTAPLQA